jgi:PBP1b-binding outer membrane lipoprotein LpoB
MKRMILVVIVFLVISGCEDMKMDRKVEKLISLVS